MPYRMVARLPRPELSGLVVVIADYVEIGPIPFLQREPAALVVPLLIGFAAPFAIGLGRPPAPDERWQSFAAGLTLEPAVIRSPGQAACLQVNFTPLGARAFFGGALTDLADRLVSLDDLGDPAITRLRQRLGETADPERRLDLAEDFVMQRLARGRRAPDMVAAAYRAIVAREGRLSVGALAAAIGCSRKHLAARFAAEFGARPKQVARLARFAAARRMARQAPAPGWADIAAATGYADQAHLAREFRALSGLAPTDWAAAPGG
jgi:AraC-like DNA-binding protein